VLLFGRALSRRCPAATRPDVWTGARFALISSGPVRATTSPLSRSSTQRKIKVLFLLGPVHNSRCAANPEPGPAGFDVAGAVLDRNRGVDYPRRTLQS